MAPKSLKQLIQQEAYQIVFSQLICVLVLSAFALIITGTKSGFSVCAGGLAYVLPNLIFVWRVFRYVGAQQMTQFVVAFFIGEMAKLILSAILFIVIVKYLAVSLLSVLIGYIGAIVSFWIVCMWQFSKRRIGVAG